MRDPIVKFPQRPSGPAHARRTLAEIRTILENPRLSPEMRTALEQRVAAISSEIAAETTHRARGASTEPMARTSPGSLEK